MVAVALLLASVDLNPLADLERPLVNPDKGWFHHYYDDGLDAYPSPDADLMKVTGLDHLYIRVPWRILEPAKGKVRWSLVDDLARRWAPRGVRIALGITCKETDGKPAVPAWVGSKGRMVSSGWSEDFEPEPADSKFLAAYESLHRRLAARYAGKPWLHSVDLRSYGDWGEGHTSFGSKTRTTAAILTKHAELLRRAWPKTLLFASDDYVSSGVPDAEAPLLQATFARLGMSYRDDSVLVGWYVQQNAATGSVRSSELFDAVWRKLPTLLEAQHYHLSADSRADDTWRGPDGSERGAATLTKAVEVARATYVGYHGWAARWMAENPNLHRRLLNRMGYHLRPTRIETLPGALRITWRNEGVAPPYRRYPLRLRVGGRELRATSDTRAWMPGETVETYRTALSGPVEVRLGEARPVELALRVGRRSEGGWYRLTDR